MEEQIAHLLEGLSESSRKEIVELLEQENKRIHFNKTVHEYNSVCFDSCIKRIGMSMDKKDESCISSCVDRFFETAQFLMNKFKH